MSKKLRAHNRQLRNQSKRDQVVFGQLITENQALWISNTQLKQARGGILRRIWQWVFGREAA